MNIGAGISIVHRRLAELTLKAKELGGYDQLSEFEQKEVEHCLSANAQLVRTLDELKSLSFIAYQLEDVEWQHAICAQIDDIEKQLDKPVV